MFHGCNLGDPSHSLSSLLNKLPFHAIFCIDYIVCCQGWFRNFLIWSIQCLGERPTFCGILPSIKQWTLSGHSRVGVLHGRVIWKLYVLLQMIDFLVCTFIYFIAEIFICLAVWDSWEMSICRNLKCINFRSIFHFGGSCLHSIQKHREHQRLLPTVSDYSTMSDITIFPSDFQFRNCKLV